MKKVFFFDVDNTLLPTKVGATIPKSAIYALDQLQKEGHDVYIATGKNKGMIEEELKIFNIKNFISSNGQVITMNNEIVYQNPFEYDEVQEIFNDVKSQGEYVTGWQEYENYYVNECSKETYDKYVISAFSGLGIEFPEVKKSRDLKPAYQLWILGEVDKLDLTNINKKFKTFRWNPIGLDVLQIGVSKAKAIEVLLNDFYQGQEVETYAFGDGYNDIEMLQLVNNGIAMGNAHKEVKEAANVVIGDINDDGIYNYLVEQKLIKEMN